MKRNLFISLILIGIMILTSCERKSGKLPEPSLNSTTVTVIIKDTYPEKILTDTGLFMYKTKCIVEKDSTTVFILTHNQFDNGDRVIIKKTDILKN